MTLKKEDKEEEVEGSELEDSEEKKVREEEDKGKER